MKKLLSLILALIIAVIGIKAQVYVNGYTRSNGTYVQAHYRTEPNYTKNDNWSTIGNINPYTGSLGTKPGGYNSSYFSANSIPSISSSYSGSLYSSTSIYNTSSVLSSPQISTFTTYPAYSNLSIYSTRLSTSYIRVSIIK